MRNKPAHKIQPPRKGCARLLLELGWYTENTECKLPALATELFILFDNDLWRSASPLYSSQDRYLWKGPSSCPAGIQVELLTFHLLAPWGETVHWLPCIPRGAGGWRKVELMGDGQMIPLVPSLSTKFIRLGFPFFMKSKTLVVRIPILIGICVWCKDAWISCLFPLQSSFLLFRN